MIVLLGSDWIDPSDPTIIAENELLSAANSIEAAAKKLSQLQPRLRPKVSRGVPFRIQFPVCNYRDYEDY